MNIASWEFCEKPIRRTPGIKVNYIEDFDARGMRLVFGRGDHYGGGRTFHMDVWRTRSGRLLARFWSRASEVDGMSLEIVGFSPTLPPRKKGLRWMRGGCHNAFGKNMKIGSRANGKSTKGKRGAAGTDIADRLPRLAQGETGRGRDGRCWVGKRCQGEMVPFLPFKFARPANSRLSA